MNFKDNLLDLVRKAHLYQYADISDTAKDIQDKKPLLFYTKIQWLIIGISIGLTYKIPKGFSDNFAGYIISGLSLFIGLFFSFLLTLYDKFKAINFSEFAKPLDLDKNQVGIRLKNFFKKVSVLSLYSLIIAIVAILFLSVTLLFPQMQGEVNIFCVLNCIKICKLYALKSAFLYAYRCIVLYFLFNFILIALYIISAFYDFIISEYDKVKLS